MPLYLATLATTVWLLAHWLVALPVPVHEGKWLALAPRDGDASGDGQHSTQPPFTLTTDPPLALAAPLKAYLFVAVLVNLGFAYTNYVTTARRAWWRGAHGGYRDLLIVNAVLPLMTAVCVMPWAQHLFPAVRADGHPLPFESSHWHAPAGAGAGSNTLLPAAPQPLQFAASLGMVVARGGALLPCLALLTGFLIGTHIPYLVRAGCFEKSISAVDVANSSARGFVGILVRIGLILYFSSHHIVWLVDTGQLLRRCVAYVAAIGGITLVSRAVRERYYFHWHHWCAGIMLCPLTTSSSPTLSLLLAGVCFGQLVDGAARWSIAPLWHRYAWAGWGTHTHTAIWPSLIDTP